MIMYIMHIHADNFQLSRLFYQFIQRKSGFSRISCITEPPLMSIPIAHKKRLEGKIEALKVICRFHSIPGSLLFMHVDFLLLFPIIFVY
jgi:hypothetical protein